MSESTNATTEAFWDSAAHCHRGKRRKTNQDAVLERPQSGLWVVADGMGGHLKGDHASRRICETLDGVTLNLMLSERVDQVEDLLHSVNDELRIHGRTHHQGATVGSTVVAMLADDQVGVALWAGDSRLYRLRRGQLEQVTRDHSPSFELFESGGITEEQLLATDSNVVTRAIGSQQALQLDIVVFDVVPGDMYLLCSDGLYRELTLDQLRETMALPNCADIADTLLELCLSGPARDNVSVIVAQAGVQPQTQKQKQTQKQTQPQSHPRDGAGDTHE